MRRRSEPDQHFVAERVDIHAVESALHRGHEQADVGIVALVVLDHRGAEPLGLVVGGRAYL
jgi:hypothetical protein